MVNTPYLFPSSRFDPEFVCNASDRRGRYSYQAQPSVCRWNLARLAEALGSELQASQAGAILDEFMPLYETLYLANMRRKLGLLRRKEPEDQELVSELLRLMHNTGMGKGMEQTVQKTGIMYLYEQRGLTLHNKLFEPATKHLKSPPPLSQEQTSPTPSAC